MDPAKLFLDHLDRIEGILRSICRRHGYRGAEAEDFTSWARERLVEDDYRVLRKFEDRAKLTTYLTAVLTNLARDYRIKQDGKWRPSAAARRIGAIGVRLDVLVHRDGLPHAQAVEAVRSEFPDAPTPTELHRIIAQLPPRSRPTLMGGEALTEVAGSDRADGEALMTERHAHASRLIGALDEAIGELSDEDQVVLRLRFEQGMTTADVSRVMGLDQKALYRRVEGLLRTLRAALERRGLGPDDVADLIAASGDAPLFPPSLSWGGAPAALHEAPRREP